MPWRDAVIDKDLSVPPVSPADLDRYIVATGGSGDWASQDANIAEFNSSTNQWEFELPIDGWATTVLDEGIQYTFNGTAWTTAGVVSTFLGLTDTPASYTTANAIYSVNGASNALIELTTLVTEPAANEFQFARGTSQFLVQGDLTVEAGTSVINQDLSTDATNAVFAGSTIGNIKIGITNDNTIDMVSGQLILTSSNGTELEIQNTAGTVQYQFTMDSALFSIDGAAGTSRAIQWETATSKRWAMEASSNAESGGDAGTNFRIAAHDDAAALIDIPFEIARVAGGDIDLRRPVVGTSTFSGTQYTSTIATGTAPLVVSSTTAVANLNADLLDGNEASAFLLATDIDTLAELNAIITDATLIDTTDARLSDARTPLAHTHPASDITAGTFTAGAYSLAGSTLSLPSFKLAPSGGQNYDFGGSTFNTDGMFVQSQSAGTQLIFSWFTKDSDGTDPATLQVYAKGSPTSVTNRERLQWGYDAASLFFHMHTEKGGTGTLRPFRLYTGTDINQLSLEIDGTVDVQGVQVFDASGNHVGPAAFTTLTSTGATTIGDGSATVAVNSSDWDISTTGAMTGFSFDANGTGNSLSNVDVADLANGTDGELITWDSFGVAATIAVGTANQVLTSNGVGAAPTFQAAPGALDNNHINAYDTTTQGISVAGTFQSLTFNTNKAGFDGWTHVTGTSVFGCNQTGKYLVVLDGVVEKSSGAAAAFGVRALFNSVEVADSEKSFDVPTNNQAMPFSRSFEVDGVSGQNLDIQAVADNTNLSIQPGPNPGTATTAISASIKITRIN